MNLQLQLVSYYFERKKKEEKSDSKELLSVQQKPLHFKINRAFMLACDGNLSVSI